MKRIIGFWTNRHGFIGLEEGLYLTQLGVVLTPVAVTRTA